MSPVLTTGDFLLLCCFSLILTDRARNIIFLYVGRLLFAPLGFCVYSLETNFLNWHEMFGC